MENELPYPTVILSLWVDILDLGERMFGDKTPWRFAGCPGNQGEAGAVDIAFHLFGCQLVIRGFSLLPDSWLGTNAPLE